MQCVYAAVDIIMNENGTDCISKSFAEMVDIGLYEERL